MAKSGWMFVAWGAVPRGCWVLAGGEGYLTLTSFRLLRAPFVGVALLLTTALAAAQPAASRFADLPHRGPRASEAVSDVRVLLVFVRFQDDPVDEATGFVPGWPASDRTRLPAFATTLLVTSPELLPGPDSSLSAYFDASSRRAPGQAGRLRVWGDVLPRDAEQQPFVYVTRHPNAWYHRASGRGYGYLTQEVLLALAAQPGFDAADYDLDRDGELDEFWLVVRSDAAQRARGGPVTYSGCANLYGCEAPLLGVPGFDAQEGGPTPPPFDLPSPSRGTVRVHWVRSGLHIFAQTASNLSAQHYFVSLLAHEWGHHLFDAEHLMPVGGRGVPAADSPGIAGYALMIGEPAPRVVGSLTLSATERALKGWATLDLLAGPSRTVTLADFYTGGRAAALPLPNGRLYLVNRQRVGFFDQVRSHPFNRALTGLLAPGLLVTYTPGGFTENVLAPDNRLEPGAVYAGGPNPHLSDVWGGEGATQVTPWTRPSSEGSDQPLGFVRTWAAIDSIRYTGRANGEMAFAYVADFRTRPVVRRHSWITTAHAGTVVPGRVVVRDNASLDIDVGPNGYLYLEGGLEVFDGSSVSLGGAGQTLTLGPVRWASGAQVVVRPGTRLRLRDARDRLAFEAPNVELAPGVVFSVASEEALDVALYPNPAGPRATLALVLNEAAQVDVAVYDVLGRRVAEHVVPGAGPGLQHLALPLDTLPAGVYVWRVAAGHLVRTGTFTHVR